MCAVDLFSLRDRAKLALIHMFHIPLRVKSIEGSTEKDICKVAEDSEYIKVVYELKIDMI